MAGRPGGHGECDHLGYLDEGDVPARTWGPDALEIVEIGDTHNRVNVKWVSQFFSSKPPIRRTTSVRTLGDPTCRPARPARGVRTLHATRGRLRAHRETRACIFRHPSAPVVVSAQGTTRARTLAHAATSPPSETLASTARG